MLYRLLRYTILFAVVLFLFVLICNIIVILSTRKGILNDEGQIPENFYALVLGTSKTFASGTENLYYKNRILATKSLLEISNPEGIILSGSNPSEYYNEPRDMYASLAELGVKEERFYFDAHGDNTFESLKNYSEKFGGDSLIIITQKFHAYRALLICKQLNINALVYPAEEVSADISNKPLIREVFARVKALADFYLFEL